MGNRKFHRLTAALGRRIFALQYSGVTVEFAQSARKHRVGRARVRQALANALVKASIPADSERQERIVFLGADDSGRVLEVLAVAIEGGLLVIHAMDLRPKWRDLYEKALRERGLHEQALEDGEL